MGGRLTTPSIDQTPEMAWQLGEGPSNMRPSQFDPGINRDWRLGPQADCIVGLKREELGHLGTLKLLRCTVTSCSDRADPCDFIESEARRTPAIPG